MKEEEYRYWLLLIPVAAAIGIIILLGVANRKRGRNTIPPLPTGVTIPPTPPPAVSRLRRVGKLLGKHWMKVAGFVVAIITVVVFFWLQSNRVPEAAMIFLVAVIIVYFIWRGRMKEAAAVGILVVGGMFIYNHMKAQSEGKEVKILSHINSYSENEVERLAGDTVRWRGRLTVSEELQGRRVWVPSWSTAPTENADIRIKHWDSTSLDLEIDDLTGGEILRLYWNDNKPIAERGTWEWYRRGDDSPARTGRFQLSSYDQDLPGPSPSSQTGIASPAIEWIMDLPQKHVHDPLHKYHAKFVPGIRLDDFMRTVLN